MLFLFLTCPYSLPLSLSPLFLSDESMHSLLDKLDNCGYFDKEKEEEEEEEAEEEVREGMRERERERWHHFFLFARKLIYLLPQLLLRR